MSTEAFIKNKVREELTKEGYITWVPAKVKYQETDIFGIWDLAAWKDTDIRFIQYTSDSNVMARKHKIEKFFEEHNVFYPCEIWGWSEKKKEFRKIYL